MGDTTNPTDVAGRASADAHDPLCPYEPERRTKCTHGMDADGGYSIESITTDLCDAVHYWPGGPCECDLIERVRAGQEALYERAYRLGLRDGATGAAKRVWQLQETVDETTGGPDGPARSNADLLEDATFHGYACTGSNESGQPGSRFGGGPDALVPRDAAAVTADLMAGLAAREPGEPR